MRKTALALASLFPIAVRAADWTGYASIATDNIERGVSVLDDGLALQLGTEGRFDDLWVAGAWAARAQRQWWLFGDVSSAVELNVYGGVDFACGDDFRVRATAARYLFPGSDAREWSEVTGGVAWRERIGASFAYSPRGLGSSYATRTTEGWIAWPLTRALTAELDYGNVSIERFDYWFAKAALSRKLDRVVVELAYHWADPQLRRFGFDDRSRRAVVTVSTAW